MGGGYAVGAACSQTGPDRVPNPVRMPWHGGRRAYTHTRSILRRMTNAGKRAR